MPYTSNAFTVDPQIVGEPSVFTLNDTSAGNDAAVTVRRVYLQKSDGSYLVPQGTTTSYIVWPIGDASIEIDALDKSYCLNIIVHWVNAAGAALYTASALSLFTMHLEQFYYDLTQTQTGTPNVVNDTAYYQSKVKLRCALDEAQNALVYGSDQYSAQAALDRGTYLKDNETIYF
jgi:hypothetical protein